MRLNVLTSAFAALLLAGCAGAPPQAGAPAPVARNIIFFLGDGMGINTLTAARIFAVGEDGDLTIDTLPELAYVKTFSNDAQVTDSAASMTAYMTGVKVNNGVISMTTDTTALAPGLDANGNKLASRCKDGRATTTLLELAKERGMAAGVVSTVNITDATPAATYAHACHRQLYTDIAAAMVPGGAGYNSRLGEHGIDVVLGGGAQYFMPAQQGGKRGDGRNLIAEMTARGASFAATGIELAALDPAATTQLLGLFAGGDMSYDQVREPAGEPSLAEMAGKAIGVLARNPKGFFLMVEGGKIDLALHDTHAKRALQEVVAFDQAVKAAIGQMRALDPGLKNTLIVVTADHDHTLLLNGYARRTGKTSATEPGVLGLVKKVADGTLERDMDGAPYTIIGFGTGENRVQGSRGAVPHLTDAVVSADGYHQEAVVRTHAGDATHGGTDVVLGAIGAGAQSFRGTIDNTRVFGLIKAAAGW